MAASQQVYPTRHLEEDRWPQRASTPSNHASDIETAWARALELDIATGVTTSAYPRLPPHDEARIDPVTRTVLFRYEERLVTCYDVDTVTSYHGHAARAAVTEQYPELIQNE